MSGPAQHGVSLPPALRGRIAAAALTVGGVLLAVLLAAFGLSARPTGPDPAVGPGAAPLPSGTSAIATRAWYYGGGSDYINTVSADLATLTGGAAAGAAFSNCGALATHVGSAQAYLPIPVQALQDRWTRALADAAAAAADCTQSPADMSLARVQLQASTRELRTLTALLATQAGAPVAGTASRD